MKVRFAYLTKKPDEVKKVQRWLNEYHMTVNRESTVNVDEQGLQELRMFEQMRLIQVREIEGRKEKKDVYVINGYEYTRRDLDYLEDMISDSNGNLP